MGGNLQSPVVWDNQQYPRIYDAFTDIWELMTSMGDDQTAQI